VGGARDLRWSHSSAVPGGGEVAVRRLHSRSQPRWGASSAARPCLTCLTCLTCPRVLGFPSVGGVLILLVDVDWGQEFVSELLGSPSCTTPTLCRRWCIVSSAST